MEGGSKLSKLQRWILTHAHKNRVAEHRDLGADGADLFYGQVLAGFYQFPRTAPWEIWEPWQKTRPVAQTFSACEIGQAKYNAAHAAVSRALERLRQRGLIDILRGTWVYWKGINLTGAGAAFAERQANNSESSPLTASPQAGAVLDLQTTYPNPGQSNG